MPDISVSIDGINEVLANLAAALEHIQAGAQEALAAELQFVYDQSQAACPVDTGALKASGELKVGQLEGSVTYGNEQVDYGLYVEMGHHTRSGSFVSAQPFLGPAYIEGMYRLKQDLGAMLV